MAQLDARERVHAACEELVEVGERVTVAGVRRRARVSMQDACDGVRDWREARMGGQAIPEAPEVVARALRSVWGAALSAAREEVEPVASQARAAQEQAEAEVAELVIAVGEAEGSREQAMGEVTRLQGELDLARQENDDVRKEIFALREEVSAAREARAKDEGWREHAEAEASRLRADLAVAQETIRKLEAAADEKAAPRGTSGPAPRTVTDCRSQD